MITRSWPLPYDAPSEHVDGASRLAVAAPWRFGCPTDYLAPQPHAASSRPPFSASALWRRRRPPWAGASSPTKAQYEPQVHATFNGGGGGNSGSGLDGNVGPLPFTGFDVLSMAAVALAVTGAGLLLQRAVSRRPHEDVGGTGA